MPAANSPRNTAANQRPNNAFERHQLALERERESTQVKLVCNNFGALQPDCCQSYENPYILLILLLSLHQFHTLFDAHPSNVGFYAGDI